MWRVPRLVGYLALLLLLIGCTGQAAPPNSPPSTTNNSTAPTPELPIPASNEAGVVIGKLMNSRNQSEAKPMAEAPIYLGTILKSETGAEGLVQLVKESAPKAIVDAQGNFVFNNVPPGRYGLMLDTPRGAILLNKPVTGESMIAAVSAGQTFDFGELRYDLDIEFK